MSKDTGTNPFEFKPTSERLSEEEWSKRENWMRELLDASNDGFWEWNVQTGEVNFSGRWAEMLGYLPGEIPPNLSSWEILVHPDDMTNVMEVLQAHLSGRTPHYETEHRLRCRDGTWKWVLDRGRVVEWLPDGRPLRAAGAHIDITERHRLEQEREEISRGRIEILGVVSHELKNPIHTILSGVELLKRWTSTATSPSHGITAPPVSRVLDGMQGAIRRMERIVRDLLLTTQLERKDEILHFGPVKVDAIVLAAIRETKQSFQGKAIDLQLSLAPGTERACVLGDEGRLIQVLSNLLDNASKFTPKSGKVKLQVTIPRFDPRNRLVFEVSDSGPGVPDPDKPRVFMRFWQSKKHAYQGTGLGLYLAKELVEAHGGAIDVCRSELGGAKFTFSLPLLPGETPNCTSP